MIWSTFLSANPPNQNSTNNNIEDVFGKVNAPGPEALSNPGSGLSTLMVTGIQLVFFVGGLLLLGYLLYGAFLWITSGGEEDKVAKARNTMMYAVIGIVLLVASLVIFVVVAGNILGIIQRDEEGNIIFDLPSVTNQQNTAP
jgi:hypothetical protein